MSQRYKAGQKPNLKNTALLQWYKKKPPIIASVLLGNQPLKMLKNPGVEKLLQYQAALASLKLQVWMAFTFLACFVPSPSH